MSAQLTIVEGPMRGKVFPIKEPEMVIGRAEDVDLRLNDVVVSRRHALIRSDGHTFRILDEGSRFGTIINQTPVKDQALEAGDIIRIGRHCLAFSTADGAPEGTREDASSDGLISSRSAATHDFSAPREETLEAFRDHTSRLKALLQLSTALHEKLEISDLLQLVLERISEILEPDRAYILLVDPQTGALKPAAMKDKERFSTDAGIQLPISRTLCKRVIESQEAVITSDATTDNRFAAGASIHDFSIRSAMCAPLIHQSKVVGLIHLDNEGLKKHFKDDDLELLLAVAGTAGSAVANAMLTSEVREHERIRSNLSRFFSPGVVDQVVGTKGQSDLSGERLQASILFADIRGFTLLSQNMPVEEVVLFLNRFFSMAVKNIFYYGGTLDKFLGDGLMAIFGAPVAHEHAAYYAVKSATEIMRQAAILNQRISDDNSSELQLGIGIATGDVIVGTMGSPERLEYTAIGKTVNLGARLCAIAEPGQVLIDKATADDAGQYFALSDLGGTNLKGFTREIKYFDVQIADDDSRSAAADNNLAT